MATAIREQVSSDGAPSANWFVSGPAIVAYLASLEFPIHLPNPGEKWENPFEEFTIALESSLKSENFVYAEPAGVSNFSWVEFEVSGHPFRKPPVQLVTTARGGIFPHFPHRPYAQADLFSDLAHKRSSLILPSLYLAAQRGPVSGTGYIRTALD